MKYNKLFIYENTAAHKRPVNVTDDLKVTTGMLPKEAMSFLARELSTIIDQHTYARVCPYKFDTVNKRHIHIFYGIQKQYGYEIYDKEVVRKSRKGNFKIMNDTFLYDLFDYFVQTGLMNEKYEYIGENEFNGLKVVDLYSKEQLIEDGFKFPNEDVGKSNVEKYPICPHCKIQMKANHIVEPEVGRIFGYTCFECGYSEWDK